ncbi:family 16 glycosylhydrolase [Tamlana fucoidanivorans]|uniref:Glycosyl hydrolase family protein n=1 Tax=Allotamlana fucoidanivorans TaxID=2583814 RepID=A0A5C4SPN2_9FLAO|nr:family 16 glycosylhydrolase [Tamlana fucoidanivorans]TNJ46214.1 glycosyl hydrolase family protein [Tamlana fucoidanivorans]
MLNKYLPLTLCCSLIIFASCSKSDATEDDPEVTPILTMVNTKIPEKTAVYSDVLVGGTISYGNDDFQSIEQGVVWAETELPTINDNKQVVSSTSNDFTTTISELKGNAKYYFRAYLSSNSETIYGDQKDITTDKAPSPVAFLPDPGNGKMWVIQPEFSNEFEYSDKTDSQFSDDWQDSFFNGWTGPKKSGTATTSTVYTPENSSIQDGKLVYKATIDGNNVHTGCVTSKAKVGYPLYMEARAKISESSLATAVWLLSEDSTQEIDNLEAYGSKDNDYFSKRLHLSHHTFIRDPFQDYQPKGPETYYADGKGTQWADDYHNYGILWLDPWTLKYYVDGELVRETPTDEIDPLNYTNGTGLNKDMYLIISAAAQPWRETVGQVEDYTTDPSVISEARSTSKFEYIRTYKPE